MRLLTVFTCINVKHVWTSVSPRIPAFMWLLFILVFNDTLCCLMRFPGLKLHLEASKLFSEVFIWMQWVSKRFRMKVIAFEWAQFWHGSWCGFWLWGLTPKEEGARCAAEMFARVLNNISHSKTPPFPWKDFYNIKHNIHDYTSPSTAGNMAFISHFWKANYMLYFASVTLKETANT